MPRDEGANICFQLRRRGMDAATNLLPGEFGKPTLDLIDPRSRCWREVDMIVRSARQPGFDHSRFVSGVIVHDDMDVEALGNARVDLLQEIKKLGGAMAFVAFADHKAGRDVEGREQRRCAVADVRVSSAFRDARHHGQDWLLAIKGLYLAFLVNAQHQRPIGRRQIKTDDVADLVDEQRVIGKLERLRAMRLQAESVPNPPDRRMRKPGFCRHRADRPVRGILWRGPKRALNDGGDLIIIDCPGSARTGLVQQPFDTVLQKASTPLADGVLTEAEFARNGFAG